MEPGGARAGAAEFRGLNVTLIRANQGRQSLLLQQAVEITQRSGFTFSRNVFGGMGSVALQHAPVPGALIARNERVPLDVDDKPFSPAIICSTAGADAC